jgi:hypothetical protein
MSKVASSTKTRKAKGRRLQQEVADELIKQAGASKEAVKVAIMGEKGPDVTFLSFCIECTNSEKINLWKKIEQTERNATEYQKGKPFKVLPMFVFKRNNSKTYGAIEFKTLIALLICAVEGSALGEALAQQILSEQQGEGPVGNA